MLLPGLVGSFSDFSRLAIMGVGRMCAMEYDRARIGAAAEDKPAVVFVVAAVPATPTCVPVAAVGAVAVAAGASASGSFNGLVASITSSS